MHARNVYIEHSLQAHIFIVRNPFHVIVGFLTNHLSEVNIPTIFLSFWFLVHPPSTSTFPTSTTTIHLCYLGLTFKAHNTTVSKLKSLEETTEAN